MSPREVSLPACKRSPRLLDRLFSSARIFLKKYEAVTVRWIQSVEMTGQRHVYAIICNELIDRKVSVGPTQAAKSRSTKRFRRFTICCRFEQREVRTASTQAYLPSSSGDSPGFSGPALRGLHLSCSGLCFGLSAGKRKGDGGRF